MGIYTQNAYLLSTQNAYEVVVWNYLRGWQGVPMRALSIICLLFLGNCASQELPPKLAWQHYDECAETASSFVAMADCGKQKRTEYCQTLGDRCGGNGAAVVAYADSLATSLKRREILEPEARRRWIEFRMTQSNAQAQRDIGDAAVRAALIAATRP